MVFDYLGQFILHVLHIKPKRKIFNSILIIRNDHIGDAVLSLPVLRAIRNIDSRIRIFYLCSPMTAPILKHCRDIDQLIFQAKDETNQVLASRLNDSKPEVVLNFNSTPSNARLVARLRAPVKVAYAYKTFNIFNFNRFVFIHRRRDRVHELDFMLGFLKSLGFENPRYVTRGLLPVSPSAKKRAEDWLRSIRIRKNAHLVGVHPGSRLSADNWSVDRYIRFITLFSRKHIKNTDIVVLLGPAETGLMSRFKKDLPICPNVHLMENNLPLDALTGLINRMDLLISSSTGPMHIAGALEVTTLSLFSSRKAQIKERWHPLNSKWHVVEALPHKTINESVGIDTVIEQADRLLLGDLTK